MPEGARKGIKDSATSSNMPREICNCVDYLWNHLSSAPDMLWQAGDEAIESQIQEWMDNGQDFDTHVLDTANDLQQNVGVYSVARQFLLLLKYISGGIIPVEYHYLILRGAGGVNALLESLSGINVNALLYIVGRLARAIEAGINERRLLDIFEPLIIAIPRGKDSSRSKALRRDFLKKLLDPSTP
ncbi:hypothetical protein AWJ20_5175 [Sugiyamaella lignohabitans]|uniref:Uncharacterized protein n=1 Tax=Sugiyamaella lignohabitans TaxID=796027 RepID=A0A167ELF5_9ASCO|nr:uncharacterized protein AWJ20_5175 [Sugiyamaella lignohabitans]ANB14214.1 hypothetical protein AWJ20_5175 [Sugiyamaella lignohabitans]